LQEENISLTDLTKLIPQNEAAQVTESWSARSTTKEGEVLTISYYFCLYMFLESFIERLLQ